MMQRLLIVLLLMLASPLSQASPKTTEYNLKNGLQIIVREDHRAPIIVSQICYKVGGAYETPGLTGISHALEHMMFKGTRKYKPGMFSKIVARNGGQENAYTTSDYTCYYQQFSKDKLYLSFMLEADRMFNLSLDPKEFAKEIKVVKEERRMRTEDNPQSLTYERFAATAHVKSPYHHPIIGWMSDLNHMTATDLRQWYHTWYAPNNAIVIVVGDVRPKDVLKQAKKYFTDRPKAYLPPVKPQPAVRPLGKRQLVVKAPAKLPWMILGYNVPSLNTVDTPWKAYALEVLSALLDGGNSARLPKDLIRRSQIASSVGVNYDLATKFDGLFTISATPSKHSNVQALKKAILQEIKKLQQHVVTAQEMQRIKAQVIADNTYAQDSQFYQAMLIGRLESIGQSWHVLDDFVKNIQNVTPQQVLQVANEYLVEDNLTAAELQPQEMIIKH